MIEEPVPAPLRMAEGAWVRPVDVKGLAMGAVLSFRNSCRPSERLLNRHDHSAAEIIIFPGVRIERHQLELSDARVPTHVPSVPSAEIVPWGKRPERI